MNGWQDAVLVLVAAVSGIITFISGTIGNRLTTRK